MQRSPDTRASDVRRTDPRWIITTLWQGAVAYRDGRSAGVRSVAALMLIGGSMGAPIAIRAQTPPPPNPFELFRAAEGEPRWAPLLRLRAAEQQYVGDPASRDAWRQAISQAEANIGNYVAAMREADARTPPNLGDPADAFRRFSRARPVRILDTLLRMADTARLIMINERHHAASDRLLTLDLLPALWAKGYRYFAAEALPYDERLTERGYMLDLNGYNSEPVFAEVIREALRLGFTLVPYEVRAEQMQARDSLSPQQRRDRAQAQNLYAATFQRDPAAKVLVHAGYSHTQEVPTPEWTPMAWYLRQLTGIDPVTVDQTNLTEHSAPEFGHPLHRAPGFPVPDELTAYVNDSAGTVIGASVLHMDFVGMRGRPAQVDGRPAFLTMRGRRVAHAFPVPECSARHCFVVAHAAGVPGEAAALDRAEADHRESVTLFLPPTPVIVSVFDESGTLLREWTRRSAGETNAREDPQDSSLPTTADGSARS